MEVLHTQNNNEVKTPESGQSSFSVHPEHRPIVKDALLNVSKQLIRDKYSDAKNDNDGLEEFRRKVKGIPQNSPETSLFIKHKEQLHKDNQSRLENEDNKTITEKNANHTECGKYAIWHTENKFYVRLPCNSWKCPVCNPKLSKDLRNRMESSPANHWPIKTHITLTVSGEYESKVIDEAFNDLMTYLRRGGEFTYTTVHGGKKTIVLPKRENLKYISVKELQHDRLLNTGEIALHKHVVFNQHLDKYDIIPIWNHVLKLHGSKSIFNYVEATYPRNFNAGRYLFKYFTKMEHQDYFTLGERRYSSSRGVIPARPVKIPKYEWELMQLWRAKIVLLWHKTDDPKEREKLASQLGYNSLYDGITIRRICYGM